MKRKTHILKEIIPKCASKAFGKLYAEFRIEYAASRQHIRLQLFPGVDLQLSLDLCLVLLYGDADTFMWAAISSVVQPRTTSIATANSVEVRLSATWWPVSGLWICASPRKTGR